MILTIGLLTGIPFGIHSAAFAQTEKPKATYDFSLPREEKIKLAERAAPPEISGKATVYILEPSGYMKVRDVQMDFRALWIGRVR